MYKKIVGIFVVAFLLINISTVNVFSVEMIKKQLNHKLNQDIIEIIEKLDETNSIREFVKNHNITASWLSTAEAILPPEHEWVERVQSIKQDLLNEIQDPKTKYSKGDTSKRAITTRTANTETVSWAKPVPIAARPSASRKVV